MRDLLKILEEVAYEKDAVKISIIPFNTQVKVGASFRDAEWLTFDAGLPSGQETTRATWRGCVADREQPYDTRDGGEGRRALYPAAECDVDGLARLRPLTSNFRELRSTVDAMTADGSRLADCAFFYKAL